MLIADEEQTYEELPAREGFVLEQALQDGGVGVVVHLMPLQPAAVVAEVLVAEVLFASFLEHAVVGDAFARHVAVVGASGVGGAVGVQTQRFGIVQFEFVVVASCLHAAVAVQLVVRLVFVVVGQ